MAFDWNDYLTIAKNFKTDTDGQPKSNFIETKQRTAISRTYYAMFHLAVNYAKTNLGYSPRQYGPNQAHADIQGIYRRQFGNTDHQEIKQILARLHKARINCDYKEEDLGNLQSLLSSIILDADRMTGILNR